MADLTVRAAMAGLTYVLWAPDVWLHLLLWASNGWPQGGFPLVCGHLTAGRTFFCGHLTTGLTEVSLIRLNLLSRLWAPNVWPHLLLWAPDSWPHGGSHPHQSTILSTPNYLRCVCSDRRPEFSFCLGGGGLVFEPLPPLPPPPPPFCPSLPPPRPPPNLVLIWFSEFL